MKINQFTPSFFFIVLILCLFNACNSPQSDSNALTDALSDDQKANSESIQETSPSDKLEIRKPFKNITDSKATIQIKDPSKANSFTMESGTILNVPANAFVDKNGAPVSGSVDLKYNEIKKVSEIIASGIPMKVIDEDGNTQWMQTAGMFEIEGFAGGEAIHIAEGKSIEVDFVSDVDGAYDFWSFDPEKGNWDNEGTVDATPNNATLISENGTGDAAEINRLRTLTKKAPVKPTYDEANKLVFNDLDLSKCPGLKGNGPVVLMYTGTDKAKAPKNNKWIKKPGTWHKKLIKTTDKKDIYELTLLGDKMYQINVKVAPNAMDIDKENEAYKQQLAAYKANVELLKNKEAIIKQQRRQQASFRRVAGVRGFGIYNYDILWKRPDAIPLMADFDFEGMPENIKELIVVYLITDNNKTVVGLPYRDWNKFRYSPSAKNKLFAVLPDGKVAQFKNKDFKREKEEIAAAKGSEYVFSMESEPAPIDDLDALDGLLAGTDD